MKYRYRAIKEMLLMIKKPNRAVCQQILSQEYPRLKTAPGASHNHQVWRGGYLNHVQECMNIAIVLYKLLKDIRPLPFSLSDALLVLFLHDIEKPWRYAANNKEKKFLRTKEARRTFQNQKLAEYGFKLTKEQQNAMRYVEGELDDYSPKKRVMKPLAAFCHLADITSARIWFDHPLPKNDPWRGAKRGS
ncbi:MAG: hypothetical protein Q7K38_02770 [Candidatus Wildermuthbacteria bacterium]|nr:hypothetical protein [Candidatus Wildermuthbacteria bacterium]